VACVAHQTPRDEPAVISPVTAESRAELRRAVSRALDGAPVTLADDALTRESELLVERVRHRDAHGLPIAGRETGRPERFRLVRSGPHCVLVHEGTGRRATLADTGCRAR